MAITTPSPQRACVYYASPARGMHLNPPVCADWQADGRAQIVRLPLRGQAGWTGDISHLRLNPFLAGTGVAGVEVRTRHPRLVP